MGTTKVGPSPVFKWVSASGLCHQRANRLEGLPHRDDVLAIGEQCKAGRETHLYLTDCRSLYVGQVGEITAEDVVAETPRDERHGGRDRPGASSAQHALVIAAESRDSAICHVK